MANFRFPNESDEYRQQRDYLLQAEIALRSQVEHVASVRRKLPNGGELKEPYKFYRLDKTDREMVMDFAGLFGEHDSLLLYTLMFGDDWDSPCPSCTSLVDGFNATYHSIEKHAAMAVVTAAGPQKLVNWCRSRGWHSVPMYSAQNSSYIIDYAGFPDAQDPAMVSMLNVFRRTQEGIFHYWASEIVNTPMANGHPRHMDMVWPLWNLLDLIPAGRGEHPVPEQNYEHRFFSDQVLRQAD